MRPLTAGRVMLPLLLMSVVATAPLRAQGRRTSAGPAAAPATPVLIVSGRGEVRVMPDRASVEVVAESRGRDAAAAGLNNARQVQAVLDTLARLGFTGAAVATTGYAVVPESRCDNSGRSCQIIGYRAGNGVQVRLDDITRLGSVIDAALASGGATRVGVIRYSVSTEAARQLEALTAAVTQARRRAEVMATAAGGTLGALEQLTSERVDPGLGFQAARMSTGTGGDIVSFSESRPTQITPGELSVVVTVLGQWRFVPSPSPASSAR